MLFHSSRELQKAENEDTETLKLPTAPQRMQPESKQSEAAATIRSNRLFTVVTIVKTA
jgi:hypothetical protein